jgi:hypothetical protein
MPNEPSQPPASGRFARDEWELLVTLPGRVLVAASSAASSLSGESATGLAGLAAIAAGHDSASPLVREVVAAIYAESLHADVPVGDPPAGRAQTLTAGERAAELLVQHAEPADASAYRDWLSEIADAACGASASARGRGIRLADNRFLDELRTALGH